MRKMSIGFVLLALVFFGTYKGYSYWDSTYNGKTNYAIVPTGTKEKSKTDSGDNYIVNGKQVYYYDYEFTWADATGKIKHVGWDSPESTNPKPLTTGSYIKASVSDKRIIKGPSTISEADVPVAALKALK